jgi:serine phosphatase RsbU (regulator of sigma subunit)
MMIHDIFPRTRPRTDFIIFGLAVLAVLVIASLRRYDVFPRPAWERLPVRERTIDSMMKANRIHPDSVRRIARHEYESELITYFADSLGAYKARHFFDSANVYELHETVRLSRKEDDGVQFSFGGGASRARDESSDSAKMMAGVAYKHAVTFDWRGHVIGVKDRVNNVQISPKDTAQILRVVQQHFSREFQSRGLLLLSNDSLQAASVLALWHCSFSDPSNLEMKRVLKRYSGCEREFVLRVENVRAGVYDFSWRERVSLTKPPSKQKSSGWNISSIVQAAFLAVFVSGVLVMMVVFVVRLRNRASSLTVATLVAIATGGWVLMSSISFNPDIWEVLIVGLTLLLFVGFLMYGMPTAGLLSVTRETFPEKFYTLQRLKIQRSMPFSWNVAHITRWFESLRSLQPLQSMYFGRSLLLGVSWGLIAGGLLYVRCWLTTTLGGDALLSPWLFSENVYTLKLQATRSFEVWWAVALFFSTMRLLEVLVVPTIAYKLLPKRLTGQVKFWIVLWVNCLLLMWYSFTTYEAIGHAIMSGLVMGVMGTLAVYYLDMLAILVVVFVYSCVYSVGIVTAFPEVQFILLGMLISLVIMAVVAYRREPEIVSEQEYKPEFLLAKEETARMHQELAAAKSVQQRLLPACLPAVDRVEICATCIPAYEVGGDYYDFFQLDDHRLGVLIGDVSGKGISAAFYITLAKGMIVSQVRQHGSPSEVLQRVNALLYGVMERGKFVSMIYGIYDTQTREFLFANAGHNPVAVRRVSVDDKKSTQEKNTVSLVRSRGMAIGLDAGARFDAAVSTERVQLNVGDTVMLYTDGVTEAMNGAHEEYGDERFCAALAEPHTTADTLVSGVLNDVRAFVGKAHQHDDIMIVALRAL